MKIKIFPRNSTGTFPARLKAAGALRGSAADACTGAEGASLHFQSLSLFHPDDSKDFLLRPMVDSKTLMKRFFTVFFICSFVNICRYPFADNTIFFLHPLAGGVIFFHSAPTLFE